MKVFPSLEKYISARNLHMHVSTRVCRERFRAALVEKETLSPKRVNREVVSNESRVISILYNRRFVDPDDFFFSLSFLYFPCLQGVIRQIFTQTRQTKRKNCRRGKRNSISIKFLSPRLINCNIHVTQSQAWFSSFTGWGQPSLQVF